MRLGRPVEVVVGRPVLADHRRRVAAQLERDVLVRHGPRICQPTGPEPVNDTTGSRGSATSAGARSLGIGSDREHARPAGRSRPAARPSSSADSGVAGAGLSTIGAPTAIAGATLCATRLSGKLNGRCPSTGPARHPGHHADPAGRRRRRCPAAAASPENRRASSAAQRNVDAARADLGPRPLQRLAVLRGDQPGDLLGPLGQPARRRGRGRRRGRARAAPRPRRATAAAAATACSTCSGWRCWCGRPRARRRGGDGQRRRRWSGRPAGDVERGHDGHLRRRERP